MKTLEEMTPEERSKPDVQGQMKARYLLDAAVAESKDEKSLNANMDVMKETAFELLGVLAFNHAMQNGKESGVFDDMVMVDFLTHTKDEVRARVYNHKDIIEAQLPSEVEQ